MRNADILRLVDHNEVKRPLAPGPDMLRYFSEDAWYRPKALLSQTRTDAFEDRPEQLALLLAEPGLPPNPCYVPVRLPRIELPGVNDVIPLRLKEARSEPVRLRALGRVRQEGSNRLRLGERRGSKSSPMKLKANLTSS